MNTNDADNGSPAGRESNRFWENAPWAPFVIPFVVYALIGMFEPKAPPTLVIRPAGFENGAAPDAAEPNWLGFTIDYKHYPLIYTIKIAATIAALAFFWPAYRSPALWGHPSPSSLRAEEAKQSASPVHGGGAELSPSPVRGGGARGGGYRISLLAIAIGIFGAALWIALCYVPLAKLLAPLGIGDWFATDDRPAFNPFVQLKSNPAWMYTFLAIRFIGLVLVVAMMEELFLRGFLMRFVMHANWPQVPFGEVNAAALAVATIVPVLSHPLNEILAVLVWFGLVTWLMTRTKNFWDCVAAHAITNLILGVYVVIREEWWLW